MGAWDSRKINHLNLNSFLRLLKVPINNAAKIGRERVIRSLLEYQKGLFKVGVSVVKFNEVYLRKCFFVQIVDR